MVYDITKYETFKHLVLWLEELKKHADEKCVVILVGNKCDLKHLRQVETNEAKAFASKFIFSGVKFLLFSWIKIKNS